MHFVKIMETAKIIQLKDGRGLGYAEYGDSEGTPLFFFHGWPVSRLSGGQFDEAAKKLHVRVISTDRPGIGLSDYKKDRTLLDWADDVEELADQLEIKKFAILGQSGGGPYAAVCGYKIPERLTNAGILVGLAPTYIPGLLDGMAPHAKLGWENYAKVPYLAEVGTLSHYLMCKLGLDFLMPYTFGAKQDAAVLANKEALNKVMESKREVFRKGMMGAVLELKLYTSDWGFDLKDIKSKVYLFYGEKDKSVPIGMGKYYHTQIKNSVLQTYPDEGHLISVVHNEEILKTMIG